MKRLRNILVTIIPLIILFLIADYVLLVPLNIRFEEGFGLFYGLLIIAIIAYFYEDVRYIFQDIAKGHPISFPGSKIKFVLLTMIIIYFGYQLSSLPIFWSKQYHDLIGNVETKEFVEEIPSVDLSKIPTVDEDYARRLGEKKLGEDVGLGSQVYVDGEWYFYTGMTSASSDESTVGFMLSNTRTKETKFYKIAGATEIAAMRSAEGKVQQMSYSASFPLLLNIENEPTYFMTLKDNQGLVKQYAFVNVKDYSMVGTGETLSEARANYTKLMFGKGDFSNLASGERKSIKGTVERFGMSQSDGNTYYTIILKDQTNLLLMGASTISPELAITREGDVVEIEYIDANNQTKTIVSFDNLNYVQ